MIPIQNRYRTGCCFLGEGEAVLEPVDDERGGAPRRPRRRAEQERVQQRVSGPQAGAVVTALSANMLLLQHTTSTLIMTRVVQILCLLTFVVRYQLTLQCKISDDRGKCKGTAQLWLYCMIF